MTHLNRMLAVVVAFGFFLLSASADSPRTPDRLTPEEAKAIVQQRRAVKEASEQARRRAALDQTALEERVLNRKDGQQILFRRVAPSEKVKLRNSKPAVASSSRLEFPPLTLAEEQLTDAIHLGANVYGEQYSEIQWRDPEAGLDLTVWSNVNLNYLRPVSDFKVDGIQYSYFGFITHYSEKMRRHYAALAAEQGDANRSFWKTPPIELSDEYYEYYVDAPLEVEIPDKLYRQLDALFGYYVANYDRLVIEHKNAALIQEAREQDLKENPPVKPAQIIMNFTPLRGEAAE